MTDPPDLDTAAKAAALQATTRVMRALYPEVTTVANPDGSLSGSASFTPQPEHVGAPGWVQGGLSATVLDFVSARVAGVALELKVVTGTFDLRYRQPVLLDGGPYRVEANTDVPRTKTVRVTAAILDSSGRPLVASSALFVGRRDLT